MRRLLAPPQSALGDWRPPCLEKEQKLQFAYSVRDAAPERSAQPRRNGSPINRLWRATAIGIPFDYHSEDNRAGLRRARLAGKRWRVAGSKGEGA